ncbi:flavin monoamine oxidase family protein [Aestuariibius sp. 2305UL40-4]|uniref:flavin monoamine oxidase family protein n=1 Tax=Aestuariibius violaceus TaxID=3234132 RepID=UPI00345E3A71
MVETVNVVVVGGGAAGLSAAVEIEAQGLSCRILEAQARLGGRVDTVSLPDGGAFDRGAQLVNGDMTAVLALAREAGLACHPIPGGGRDLCVVGGEVLSRSELISAEEIFELLEAEIVRWDSPKEILRALWQTYRWWTTPWEGVGEAGRAVSRAVSRGTAPAGSLAAAIDGMLLCKEDAALTYAMMCELTGAAPEALDAVAIRAAFLRYASDRDDAEFQLAGGMGGIVAALARKLRHEPLLEASVREVQVSDGGVEVNSARGRLLCDRVIVAVPPPVARGITFGMDREVELRSLLDAFEAGDMIKTVLLYGDAFWRLDGLSGAVSFADPPGLEVLDTSPGDGGPPRLTAFLGGPEARLRAALPPEERRAKLLDDLARALGPTAAAPQQVAEALWIDDAWVGGGYNATVRLGRCRDAVERLSRWDGPVRFAGAELSDTFWGYVEGAIRSGRAVARDVGSTVTGATRVRV